MVTNYREQAWALRDAMEGCNGCQDCGDDDEFSPNLEAFELFSKLVCDDCAEAIFENEIDKCLKSY